MSVSTGVVCDAVAVLRRVVDERVALGDQRVLGLLSTSVHGITTWRTWRAGRAQIVAVEMP